MSATFCAPFRKALATASTATSFAAKVPTATEPTGDGVIDLRDGDKNKNGRARYALLLPFGTDGNNDTFDMKLWGWSKTVEDAIWVPHVICSVSVVLGNISGSAVGSNIFLADTITYNKGIPAGTFQGLNSPADDTPGCLVVHLLGAQKLEFTWDLAGGQEAVSMNCYYKLLGD